MANQNEMLFDKNIIRMNRAKRRNELSAEQRAIWSDAACKHAALYLDNHAARSFMVYMPFRSELDLRALIEWGWRTGRDVIVPRCIEADRTMTLHLLSSWDQLAAGAYGITEPNPYLSPAIEWNQFPDVVFVPGLAFDLAGGRLGYGGGYYDRFAASRHSSDAAGLPVKWIGAAFEDQLMEQVPLEDHDVRMDGIVTEKGVFPRTISD